MLILHHPYLSVDLDTAFNGAAIARGGWAQAVAQIAPGETYLEADEKVTVQLTQDSDVYRAAFLSALTQLSQYVRELQSADHPDHLNPAAHVYVRAKTSTEVNSRWARVTEITIQELSPLHYGSTIPKIKVHFSREGLWRGIDPTGYPTELVDLSGEESSMRSTSDMGDGCHFTINPLDILGDAPGTLKFTIWKSADFDGYGFCLVKRTAFTTAELNAFDPFIWFDDNIAGSPTMVSKATMDAALTVTMDTTHPTTYHRVQATGQTTTFAIDPAAYAGRFTAYVIYAAYEDTATVRLTHGFTAGVIVSTETKELDQNITGSAYLLCDMGQIQIPHDTQRIRGDLTYSSDYIIRVITDDSTNSKTFVVGICLVPVEDQSLSAELLPDNYQTIIDGEIQRVYHLTYPAGEFAQAEQPYGLFPKLTPAKYNRFYILPEGRLLMNPAVDINMLVHYIPRWHTISSEVV